MKVHEMIDTLKKYNPNAAFYVVVNGCPKPFEVCFGLSEGCTPAHCECVSLLVETPKEHGTK